MKEKVSQGERNEMEASGEKREREHSKIPCWTASDLVGDHQAQLYK